MKGSMKSPKIIVSNENAKSVIVIVIEGSELSALIVNHIISLDLGLSYNEFILCEGISEINIFASGFTGSLQFIKDILTEHDNKIISIRQYISVNDIVALLPEISSVAWQLYRNNAIEICMQSDKFRLAYFSEDKNKFDGIGLDIVKTPVGDGVGAYLTIYVNTIHELRKLKLLGIMDCIGSDSSARIEIPGFVFESYSLI